MSEAVLQAIAKCEWSPVKFLIFSDNVFAPLIYYSHVGTLVVALFFGLFVFLNNKKEHINLSLLYITIAFSVWMFSDLVLWATNEPKYTMFFWTVEIIFEPLIYILALRFFYTLINHGQKISLKPKILGFLLLLPTIIFAPTKLGLIGYDLTNCDRAAIEGFLPKYGYCVEVLIVIWIVLLAFNKFRKSDTDAHKKQIVYTAIGIVLFLLSFSIGNIAEVITENWYIGQFGYIGIPIFIGFLSYQIVEFRIFKIKLIGSQVLVSAIWFLIFSLLFVRTIENARLVTAITLALFSILAMLLVRSVKREVEQREKIEKLAKDLELANSKLRELDEMKSEFLSLATHQIRAPLTAIKGYSSMLLEGDFGVLPDKARASIETIMKSCQNLINIVADFLNISRIEQGRMVYEKSLFDLTEMVQEAVNEIGPNVKNAGLGLQLKIPAGFSVKIEADRSKLKQVVSNLIDNAIKYTKEGSVIVELKTEKNKIKIAVSDTGVGIAAEEMDKLFNKFSRTKDANKINVIGTGLGLYIAKKMIEAHHGDIKVRSEVGKGSTFTIELPKLEIN